MSDPLAIYHLLNEIFLILDDGDQRFFSRFNLTPSRYYALFHLGQNPGISFSELSALMLCDKSNITRIVKGLEASDLVFRRPHETDGRTLRLFLSEEGARVCQEATLEHHFFNENRFEDLGQMAQDDLLGLLQRLKAALRKRLEDEDAGRTRLMTSVTS
jgi:MarR family transcriptional regulator, 2-MHQ and catechol-resistance regulon repressor